MTKVVEFTGVTRLDISPDRVLDAARGELESVVLCGYDKDGNEYFASSVADGGAALWMLERAKQALLSDDD